MVDAFEAVAEDIPEQFLRLRATLRTRLDAQVSEIVALTRSGTVRSTTTSNPLSYYSFAICLLALI